MTPDIESIARVLEGAASRLEQVANVCRFDCNPFTIDDLAAVARDMGEALQDLNGYLMQSLMAYEAHWSPHYHNEPAWPKLVTRIAPGGSAWIVKRT
jgi:hypothetical protein